MKGEFYKMEYEAWDEGTDCLSLELEAAYLRLCHQMYRRHGRIPDQPNTLCRIWRCHPNKANRILDDLVAAEKVIRAEGFLSNARVAKEIDHRDTLSRHRADAGHTGGRRSAQKRAKPLETNDTVQANKGYKRREEYIDTLEADASNGAEAPERPSDPVELLWFDGPPALEAMGSKPREARSCIGRWLRDTGDNANLVLGAILRARDLGTRDPVPVVSRILNPVNGKVRASPERERTIHDVAKELEAKFARPDHDEFDLLPGIRQQAH